ncbi:MAG: YafY family protein [Pseudomonadota bacterium]
MRRATRLFEIIQALRTARGPLTADAMAERLEVSTRTVYRDIAALQAMRTPIEGAAGMGYVMRRGYDLPALNFDEEEIEALRVGLTLLSRTGDSALQRAAARIRTKIDALADEADWLQVAPYGAPSDRPGEAAADGLDHDPAGGSGAAPGGSAVPIAMLRDAVREARKLRLCYRDGEGRETERQVRPVALVYHLDCTMLAAWCELREGFRHFRTDRLLAVLPQEERFAEQSAALRALWLERNRWLPA